MKQEAPGFFWPIHSGRELRLEEQIFGRANLAGARGRRRSLRAAAGATAARAGAVRSGMWRGGFRVSCFIWVWAWFRFGKPKPTASFGVALFRHMPSHAKLWFSGVIWGFEPNFFCSARKPVRPGVRSCCSRGSRCLNVCREPKKRGAEGGDGRMGSCLSEGRVK